MRGILQRSLFVLKLIIMETLKDIFINEIGLNEEHFIQFSKRVKKVHLQKKEFLIMAGDICSFIGFVQEGVLRTYVQNDAEEYNIDFHLPTFFVSGYIVDSEKVEFAG